MKHFLEKLVCCASLGFALSFCAWGNSLTYEIVETPAGMSDRISSVCVVPGGFIWCGTDEGLLRLDYREFRRYTAESTGGALCGDDILQLRLDHLNRLWVATDKGVSYYDYESGTFVPVMVDMDGVPTNLLSYSFIEYDNVILFGGSDHLYSYSFETEEFSVANHFESQGHFDVDEIHKGPGGIILLVDYGNGIFSYSPADGSVVPFRYDFSDSSCLLFDRYNRLWRSVYGKGLECYNTDFELIASYNTFNSDLSCDVITCIAEKGNEIWISTEVGGINILDTATGKIKVLSRQSEGFYNLPANSISSLFCDGNGTVWASMASGGLISIKESGAKSYYLDSAENFGNSIPMQVSAITLTGGNEKVWIGTHSAGIRCFDRQSGAIEDCPNTANYGIESMTGYGDRQILFKAATKGLFLFDKRSGLVKGFKYSAPELDSYFSKPGARVNLVNDYAGNILLFSDRVYLIDTRTGKMTDVTGNLDENDLLYPVVGSAGTEFYSKSRIYRWMAETAGFNLVTDFGSENINCVAIDSQGAYWVASDDGVHIMKKAHTSFEKLETDLFDKASVIACDKRGRVWVGSGTDMYVYQPELDSFVLTDSSDGIMPNSFTQETVIMTDDEHLLLGGSDCFIDIDSSISFLSLNTPTLTLLGAYLDGVQVDDTDDINIRTSFKSFKIRVFASEDNILRKKKFRFLVSGPNLEEETFISDEPEFIFDYRDSGRYRIFASCTTRNGAWTEAQEVLDMRVTPSWYGSWFLLLGILVLSCLVIALVISYFLKRRSLEIRHESDKEKLHFLLNVSHELKTPLTLIIGPLERVIDETPKGSATYNRLTNIRRQALRMRTLILTVLDSHKIDEGAASLNAYPVEFNAWVGKIAGDFRDEMESRLIELKLRLSDRVGTVSIDSEKLINVMTNMLINALKHSPNESIITVGTEMRDNGVVRVFVSDKGPGLGGVDMTKLFGRYYQSVTEKTGTGMGLAYSDSIVRLHGGSMGAFDNPDGGATFYFEIPTDK